MKKYHDQAALATYKRQFMQYVESIISLNTAHAYAEAASSLLSVIADEPVFQSAQRNGSLPELCRQHGRARAIADIQLDADGNLVEITQRDLEDAALDLFRAHPVPPEEIEP